MNFIKEKKRIYCVNEEDKVIAEITFEKIDKNTMNINHTFVHESLRGQGIASKLVQEAVKYIQAQGLQVKATCSYAKRWLDKNER